MLTLSKDRYISRDVVQREKERLWPRAWLMACREEELKKPGDFVVFDIADESIIVVRDREDRINAFFNVCQHRGRRLLDNPGCGHTAKLFCKYHGWRWNLDGTNDKVLDRADWDGTLSDEEIALKSLKVRFWGGFVFVNMSSDPEDFDTMMAPVVHAFRNYGLETLRLRWKRTTGVACNWKVAIDVFIEAYHAQVAHRQGNLGTGDNRYICEVLGRHSVLRYRGMPTVGELQHNFDYLGAFPEDEENYRGINTKTHRAQQFFHTLNSDLDALITKRFLRAVDRMVEDLPGNPTSIEMLSTIQRYHREEGLKDGVEWDALTPEDLRYIGTDWQIFPNVAMLATADGVLLYRGRPDGDDPDRCFLDVWVMERMRQEDAPVVDEAVYADWQEGTWPRIYPQDFESIPYVQKGMKSRGFRKAIINPLAETTVYNLHTNIDQFMSED